MRPLVGVTGPGRGGAAGWLFTRRCIERAGGRAVRLTPTRGETQGVRGIVLGGGADLASAPQDWTGQTFRPVARAAGMALLEPRERLRPLIRGPALLVVRALTGVRNPDVTDPARDEFEHDLLDRAMRRELPVLGICRGAQLINSHLDGTLHGDIRSRFEKPGMQTVLPSRRINVMPGTRLADLLDTTSCHVNALHRQAIRTTGRGLVVSAVGDNGTIQAIEHTLHPFLIGVQWHPEYLPGMRRQRALFTGLVDACAGAPHLRS